MAQTFAQLVKGIAATNAPANSLTIDSSGRLLVGTSSTSTNAKFAVQGRTGGDPDGQGTVYIQRGGSSGSAITNQGIGIGDIYFADSASNLCALISGVSDGAWSNSNDFPGRLVFSTTADGASSPTERMRIDSSGRVGIGISSPAGLLDLGAADSATALAIANWRAASYNGSILQWGGITASQWSTAAFFTGGSERMRVDSSGRVGIGTTSPYGQFAVVGEDSNGVIASFDSGTGYQSFMLLGTTDAGNGTIAIQPRTIPGSGIADFYTYFKNITSGAGTTRHNVIIDGKVGIGTTAPGSQLDILGTTPSLHVGDNTGGAPDYRGYSLDFSRRQQTGGINLTASSPSVFLDLYAGGSAANLGDWNGQIRFFTGGNNEYGLERARIDNSGRLLIGTTTTSDPATILLAKGSSTYGQISADNSSATGGGAFAALQNGTRCGIFGTSGFMQGDTSNDAAIFAETSKNIRFYTNGSAAEKARITSGGNLLVGTTTATQSSGGTSYTPRFVVYAGDQAGFYSRVSTAGAANVINNEIGAGTRYLLSFDCGATRVGDITSNGTTTTYGSASDYRLKENIVSLTGAIDRVNDLQVHRFNFIADPNTTVDGFIAHEVQAIVPECVTGEKDAVDADGNPIYQGIDQSKLVPLLTAALQETITELQALKAEVAVLKGA